MLGPSFSASARAVLIPIALLSWGCEPSSAIPPDAHFDYPLDDELRLQHAQVKATHNSYHVANPELPNPASQITMAPLDVQLGKQGVRGFELDLTRIPDEQDFSVFNAVPADQGTTCDTLTKCLGVIKSWSDAHRAHMPLMILLDIKDPDPGPGKIEAYFGALHAAILSIWPEDRILRPDDVQGLYPTLGDAVRTEGWPFLGALRGRVIFAIDNIDAFGQTYSRKGTSLAGRIAFTKSLPSDPIAAFTQYDDPELMAPAIAEAVAANMLVRTHADFILDNLPTDTRRAAALASGAYLVTTDFPAPANGMVYWVDIPNGTPARCDPVTAPETCTPQAIEDPAYFGE